MVVGPVEMHHLHSRDRVTFVANWVIGHLSVHSVLLVLTEDHKLYVEDIEAAEGPRIGLL